MYTKKIFIANSITANCNIMKYSRLSTTHNTNSNKLWEGHCTSCGRSHCTSCGRGIVQAVGGAIVQAVGGSLYKLWEELTWMEGFWRCPRLDVVCLGSCPKACILGSVSLKASITTLPTGRARDTVEDLPYIHNLRCNINSHLTHGSATGTETLSEVHKPS